MAQKRLVFTSKSPTPWHHGMAHTLFPTHLRSFDGPIAVQEQRPSLETRTGRPTIVLSCQDDRPINSPKKAIFGH